MKKSTILTFATAGAIVATSLGTFAAWDTTEATNSGTLSVGTPVTITTTAASYTAASRTLGEAPVYSSDVTFNVNKKDEKVSELDVTDIVVYEKTDTSKATPVTGDFTISIAGASGDAGVTPGSDGKTLVDKSVDASNTYTVTLTPAKESVAGKEYVVDVKASIK